MFSVKGRIVTGVRDFHRRMTQLLFENCLINGIKAYRIRPYLENGEGGHGDDTLEIASASFISNAEPDREVEVTFFKAEQLS
jgi:hypothetical protein